MCLKGTCETCRKFLSFGHSVLSYIISSILTSNGLIFLDKTSWWGCGNHVPSVMDNVSVEERCSCEPKVEKDGKKYPPMAAKADWLPTWVCSVLHRK